MPSKQATPCRYGRCPNTTTHRTGYCDEHRPTAHSEYYRSRPSAESKTLYQSRAWINFSIWYRRSHPYCELCRVKGIASPAADVHHKIPVEQGGAWMDESNVVAVCRSCHRLAHG